MVTFYEEKQKKKKIKNRSKTIGKINIATKSSIPSKAKSASKNSHKRSSEPKKIKLKSTL